MRNLLILFATEISQQPWPAYWEVLPAPCAWEALSACSEVPTAGWEEVTAGWRRPSLAGRSRVDQRDDNVTDRGGGGVGTVAMMGFT
jgi:hypothetical protein